MAFGHHFAHRAKRRVVTLAKNQYQQHAGDRPGTTRPDHYLQHHVLANGVLPAVVAKYRSSRSGVEVILREGVHGTVLEDIRSGTADLGVTYVDDLPDFVESKRVSREVFDVILPRGHRLTKTAKRSSVTLTDLASFPLVSLPYESRTRRIGTAAMSAMCQKQRSRTCGSVCSPS